MSIIEKIQSLETIDNELRNILLKWLDKLLIDDLCSFNTIRSYISDIINFLTFLRNHIGEIISIKILNEITIQDIRAWLANRKLYNIQNVSNARSLSVIGNLYSYLNDFYKIDNKAVDKIKISKINKSLPRPIEEQLALKAIEIIASIAEKPWIGWRDTAILTMIYCSGMRIGEVLKIQKNQIILYNNTYNSLEKVQCNESISLKKHELEISGSVLIMKNCKKQRVISLLPITCIAIQNYLNSCPYLIKDLLFFGARGNAMNHDVFRSRLCKLKQVIGLPPCASTHVFRRSFAIHLLNKGTNIQRIQEILGHNSILETQKYIKVTNVTKLLDEYHKYHGRKDIKY